MRWKIGLWWRVKGGKGGQRERWGKGSRNWEGVYVARRLSLSIGIAARPLENPAYQLPGWMKSNTTKYWYRSEHLIVLVPIYQQTYIVSTKLKFLNHVFFFFFLLKSSRKYIFTNLRSYLEFKKETNTNTILRTKFQSTFSQNSKLIFFTV